MLTLVIQHHADRSLADFGGKLVRCLAHIGSIFSEVGASGKPGAVQPDAASVMDVAGQVSAQLLLAGSTGVAIDGQMDPLFPRPADLVSSAAPLPPILAAVGSQLFRPISQDTVEPTHRTVAEYLAARWIAKEINAKRLSVRRLIASLYVNGVVPAALRGMHAWIATLCRTVTEDFCADDPYGCLRYGDVGQFTDNQAKRLLHELQKLSDVDPYFRGSDWSAQIGAGLARLDLKDEILNLIKNPAVPYNLSTILLESLRGSELAAEIEGDLVDVATDESQAYGTRSRALEAIGLETSSVNWKDTGLRLSRAGTEMGARLSIELAIDHPSVFSGEEMAGLIHSYDQIAQRARPSFSVGIDYNLIPKLTIAQLIRVIERLVHSLPEDRFTRSNAERKTEERVLAAMKVLLSKGDFLNAVQIWASLSRLGAPQYHSSDWSNFSRTYFGSNEALRRDIQDIFLSAPEGELDTRWNRLCDAGDLAPGLYVNEADVSYHLRRLVASEPLTAADVAIWKDLVAWAIAHKSFDGSAESLARTQASNHPELVVALHELDNRPMRDWEARERERRAAADLDAKTRAAERHQQYEALADQIVSGQHLGALNSISQGYLGMHPEVHQIENPIERVRALVGDQGSCPRTWCN